MNGLIAGALGRPVAVGAACAAVALLALAVGARLPVALLPPIAAPKLYVWTAAPAGGTPAATEETVTVPVERAVADAAGLARLESWSRAEGSLVRLTFSWRTRLDGAAVEVRQLLGQATLPGGAVPVLLPDDPERRPLLLLAVEAPGGETAEGLRATQRLAESLLVPRLERVEGVGRVALVGGAHPRVRVLADETRLRQAGLAFADVERALAAANVSVPGGRLRRGAEVYAVELSGGVTSAEAIRRLPLGPSRRLGDVARVEDVLEPAGRAYAAGRPALLVAASARADANALRVADALRAEVAAAEADLRAAPGAPALAVRVLADESAEVRAAVSGIGRALAWGGVLVALVLVLTLRVGGLVLPVLVALPLSLAGAVALFAVAGLGLNLLTLAGLALAIGMLVDNALVVTEAVARQREEGRGPDEAALRGTR